MVLAEGLYNSYQERPAEIDRYREAIEYVIDESLSTPDSLELIADIKNLHARASP